MYKPTYISIATTTAVSTTPCVLRSIVIGETAAGAITIKDGETTIAVLKSSIAEGEYRFDAIIRESLSIVTAAASKLTVLTKPVTV
jgi:hypothetical protein